MTGRVLDQDAPDVEDFVICWLQPLLRAAVEREHDDPYPFAGVERVTGTDDPDEGIDHPIVQIDILERGKAASKRITNRVHRRMLLLARECPDVVMSDGRIANPDYCLTVLRPVREPYHDTSVVRMVGRYQIGLSFVNDTD